jgi:AcrR family transcriptional regulator
MPVPTKTEPILSAKKEAILIAAARLFSQQGYAAISMRVLAKEIGITPAALYHYFPSKEAIYYAVLEYVFNDKALAIGDLLRGNDAPEIKLERLIVWFAELISGDEVFTHLLHRELLYGEEKRIKLLTKEVIEKPFYEVEKLMQQLAPHRDAHLSAISVVSLIMGHFELMPISQNLVGHKKGHDKLSVLVEHVKTLILCGLVGTPDDKEKN